MGSPVNTASRIESLTKRYDTRMLISGEAAQQLQAPPSLRRIARVKVKGSSQPLTLFEVLDVLPSDRAAARAEARAILDAALDACASGDADAAVDLLQPLGARFPEDAAVRRLLAVCREATDLPTWDGTERLTEK